MRSGLQRRQAFAARMQSSQIDAALTAVNARQKAKFAASVGASYPKQVLLRDVLNAAGITGPAVFQYEAFSAECFGISRRFAGPAAVAAVLPVSEKYADTGCADATLCTIMTSVHGFAVAVPAQVVLSSPANGAPAEPKAGTLVWLPAAGATGYDVWLGPNVGPVIEVSHDQPGLAYAYAGLAGATLHDWYVFSRNACGAGIVSATWQFTTVP